MGKQMTANWIWAGHTFAGKMNRYSHGCAQRTAQPWHPFSPRLDAGAAGQALDTPLANILVLLGH